MMNCPSLFFIHTNPLPNHFLVPKFKSFSFFHEVNQMSNKNPLSSHLYLIIPTIVFILITSFKKSHGAEDERFVNCNNNPFRCGEFSEQIRYPSWGGNQSQECGLPDFELRCQENSFFTINISSQTFRVLSIDKFSTTFTLARYDLWNGICLIEDNRSIDLTNHSTFSYGRDVQRFNLYYLCPTPNGGDDLPEMNTFTCDVDGTTRTGFFEGQSIPAIGIPVPLRDCEWNVSVPVLESAIQEEFRWYSSSMNYLQGVVKRGFRLEYSINSAACSTCLRSGGLCWSGTNSSDIPTCLCPEGPRRNTCPPKGLFIFIFIFIISFFLILISQLSFVYQFSIQDFCEIV